MPTTDSNYEQLFSNATVEILAVRYTPIYHEVQTCPKGAPINARDTPRVVGWVGPKPLFQERWIYAPSTTTKCDFFERQIAGRAMRRSVLRGGPTHKGRGANAIDPICYITSQKSSRFSERFVLTPEHKYR